MAHTHEKGHECGGCRTKRLERKIRSMTSLLVIASGLVVGLLFVDVAQLFTNRGLSARALGETTIVEYDGATWVKYNEPKVRLDVFVSSACGAACDIDTLLSEVRRFVPTVEAHRIDIDTHEGAAYAARQGITTLPTLLFDRKVTGTTFFLQTTPLFIAKDNGGYMLDIAQMNTNARHSLVPISEEGIIYKDFSTEETTPATIDFYTDITCTRCTRDLRAIEREITAAEQVKNMRVKFIAANNNIQQEEGVRAVLCAEEQGKGSSFMMRIGAHTRWHGTEEVSREDVRASLVQEGRYIRGMQIDTLKTCLAEEKHADAIALMHSEITASHAAELPFIIEEDKIFTLGGFIDSLGVRE